MGNMVNKKSINELTKNYSYINDNSSYGILESSNGVPEVVVETKELAAWPGIQMTWEGNGIYSYTLPDYWVSNNTRVIFSYSKNQVPTEKPGFALPNGSAKIYENGDWKDLDVDDSTNITTSIAKIKLPSGWLLSNIYVYEDITIGTDLFKMILKWDIRKSSNNNYNILSIDMFFYHKNIWNGEIYGQDNLNNGTYISINDNIAFLETTTDVSGYGGEYLIMSHEAEVPVDSTVRVLAGCDVGKATINMSEWSRIEDSFEIYSSNEIITPPTTISITGKYEINSSIAISFSGATGDITGYEIQYSTYDLDIGWSSWETLNDNHKDLKFYHYITKIENNTNAIKYRVRAKGQNIASSWSKESNVLKHYGIKTYQNESFKWAAIKIFNGNSWEYCDVKKWDGENWVTNK